MARSSRLGELVKSSQTELLDGWFGNLKSAFSDSRIPEAELKQQATELLRLTADALGTSSDPGSEAFAEVRALLDAISRSRAIQGFSSTETATFVFSLKKPLFDLVRTRMANDVAGLSDTTWAANELVDAMGIQTIAAYQKSREDVIIRQQEDLLELSTPVVKLWDGILALPMVGTLDSSRSQVVMESLLARIVETGSEMAIIDITGVPTVDTLVAQHLLKTVTAIRLMGAECIISGIRPQIAQTIVHLGVDLRGVTTKASLADALMVAFHRTGLAVVKRKDA